MNRLHAFNIILEVPYADLKYPPISSFRHNYPYLLISPYISWILRAGLSNFYMIYFPWLRSAPNLEETEITRPFVFK